jgi:fumarate reductase subunit D
MSLSIDVSGIFGQAGAIVNSMMPLVVLVSGFALGFGLVDKITQMFSRAI